MKFFTKREFHKALTDIENDRTPAGFEPARRALFTKAALTTAGGAFLYACGSKGSSAKAVAAVDPANEIKLLDAANQLELEAVIIYTAAAQNNIAIKTTANAPFLNVAGAFLAHHGQHSADLVKKITAYGGTPTAVTQASVLTKNSLTVDAITNAPLSTILGLAAVKEKGAAQAYASLAANFQDVANAGFFATLCGDESAHYAVFRAAFHFVVGATDPNYFAAEADIVGGAYPANFK